MKAFDEMHATSARVREHYAAYDRWLNRQPRDVMQRRREEAEVIFRRVGITFAVYGAKDEDGSGTERLIPFDLIPRIIPAHEWREMETGLRQRVAALNRFLHDVYHDQEIIKAGIVPGRAGVQERAVPPRDDWRGRARWHLLHDLRHRHRARGQCRRQRHLLRAGGQPARAQRRELHAGKPQDDDAALSRSVCRAPHRPVAHYPDLLLETLRTMAPASANDPTVVVLTPGMYNSAYFEHAFLAQQMGVELVEGSDLFVKDNFVFMRTTRGPKRVDVIYRRVDDDFLDPLAFRSDSTLGCAGLLGVYRAGNVTLANAIGTGVADDKSIYPYVPKMVEFYLGEKPILQNVPTHLCREPEGLQYTLDHLSELVVKEVHGAGGYGMLVGPAASKQEIEDFRGALKANPSNYIAQPTLALSTCPTFVESGIAPRHIDLRPFVLSGKSVQMVPGGLTRVALKEGSLVVNSSQGGGTKDTWVLEN